MRIRRLGALAAATIVLACTAPAYADLLINVDKSTQRMTVSVDGVPRYVWPVSTGIAKYDTPAGNFTPFRMEKDHFSKEWDDAPMPYSIFFTKMGHAIHGTNHASIGRPASHGCVRLSVAHAAKLWDLVKAEGMTHTKVVLDGQLPPAGALVAKRNDAGQPLQIEPEQDNNDVTGAVPQDNTDTRNWDNNGDGYYTQPQQRYDDRPRYADRQPYYGRPVYRDDDRPAPFPFFLFGR
ncbi:MAG TPA: L,D-transpeptidase [Pseudolabrys sp.]|nr:L,D-transpeptidase [Pseudolabrys sp.]